ncbi:SVM family protein [Candidatus Phytoplasma asiaticum]|uniref:SVM family protein n=1 Tax=Candidatus Phytoplasma asiaticum TaxID=2763338 RepID=A0AAX3B9X2_9MOLU|nr:SVM family protein ['Parthenium hysterophorus' phyllody phytoplasma]
MFLFRFLGIFLIINNFHQVTAASKKIKKI